jgi:hypothetical protein
MAPLFAGFVVLVAVMMILRWFATATPATVLRTAKWTGAAMVVGGGALLVATGSVAWAVAAAAGLVPWLTRLARVQELYRLFRRIFQTRSGAKSPGDGHSTVETRFLRMTLDHGSGALNGEVIDGPMRGARLSQLSLDQVMELYRQCAADPQTVQVLDAWLERTWPDWRDRARRNGPARPASTAMARDEAYEVLGVAPGADPEQIKTAHRRLMANMHPDRGGSNYLAAKINQARDVLLGH